MALSKNTIKWINALRHKKYRQKYNKFIVEGDKMAEEILEQNRWKIDRIFALPPWIEKHDNRLSRHRQKVEAITPAELKKLSTLRTPNQVLAVLDRREYKPLSNGTGEKVLYLDGIQDPGNMGTILRIADWFGLSRVFCSEDCADLYNPKVIQSSMGAFLRVDCRRLPLAELRRSWPEHSVMGAVLDGENAFRAGWPAQGILVMGSEGRGITDHVEKLLTQRLTIPKAGRAESLNAGVACGILCALWVNA